MPTHIKARYANGKLEPLEPLDLAEGCEVVLEVSEQQISQYPSYVNWILAEQATWPATELDGPPSDLAKNKKHYLYGYPKEADE